MEFSRRFAEKKMSIEQLCVVAIHCLGLFPPIPTNTKTCRDHLKGYFHAKNNKKKLRIAVPKTFKNCYTHFIVGLFKTHIFCFKAHFPLPR